MEFTKENVLIIFDEWTESSDSIRDFNKRISELDDAPEKVVVPKFVAKWYESKLGYNIAWMIDNLRTGECIEKAVRAWLVEEYSKYGLRDAFDLLALIRINGYEVEKEPLYEVLIPFERYILSSGKLETCYNKLAFDNTSGESKLAPRYYQFYDNFESRLTEFEIKSIDERFWAFAVKVEESE